MSPLPEDLAALNPNATNLQGWSKKLRCELRNYWDIGITDLKDKLQMYIADILPTELAIVEIREHLEEGRLKRLPPQNSCDVLILLVGFSIEPLLQSICVWKPKKVMLLVNKAYGTDSEDNTRRGEDFAKIVQELIDYLAEIPASITFYNNNKINNRASSKQIEIRHPFILESDEPKNVFRQALEIVKKQNETPLNKIVIDITGGKKTMVTGSYLFAAFANINISYVDFDDDAYDPDKSSPYGDAFRIGILENPYTVFKLHEWKAVEELYKKQLYGRARKKVDELIGHMKTVFEVTDIKAAEKLKNLLEIYELWDRGDYRKALSKIGHFPLFTPPIAIKSLCSTSPRWPDISIHNMTANEQANSICGQVEYLSNGTIAASKDIRDSIYLQSRFLDYINDEIERINRLTDNGEYRSAFIKSYSVIECLLVSQLLARLTNNLLEVTINEDPIAIILTDAQRNELSEKIIEEGSPIQMLYALSRRNWELRLRFESNLFQTQGRNIGRTDTLKIKLCNTTPPINNFWNTLPISDLDTLRKLRNKTIHFCLWIPKDVAQAAYKWADACFNHFISSLRGIGLTCWHYTRPIIPATLDWKDACELCGIEFLVNK